MRIARHPHSSGFRLAGGDLGRSGRWSFGAAILVGLVFFYLIRRGSTRDLQASDCILPSLEPSPSSATNASGAAPHSWRNVRAGLVRACPAASSIPLKMRRR